MRGLTGNNQTVQGSKKKAMGWMFAVAFQNMDAGEGEDSKGGAKKRIGGEKKKRSPSQKTPKWEL